MRRKIAAGVLMALALLIPAAPAVAQAEAPGSNTACDPVQPKLFKDLRKLITIDLDTATDVEIRVLANQIMAAATAESLPVLPTEIQERLDGTEGDLREFLKKGWLSAWTADLRISVGRSMTDARANVQAAAQKVLDDGSIDASLAYLNKGLYDARALDCAAPPKPTKSATPSPSPSASPSATTTAPAPTATPGVDDDVLPLTGADTGTAAGIGGALLLLGGVGYLIGRRRRSRFVA